MAACSVSSVRSNTLLRGFQCFTEARIIFRPNVCEHVSLCLYAICMCVRVAAAAAKSLQSCPTLCDPIDGSPPGFPVPGILQARTLEWVAISFSSAWKWNVKVKSLSRVWLFATPWTAATRLLRPWDSPGESTGVGCYCLLYLCLYHIDMLSHSGPQSIVFHHWMILYESLRETQIDILAQPNNIQKKCYHF